jgi:hypothetical protein
MRQYKTAVLFYSRTGNTRMIAEAIAAAIGAALIELHLLRSELDAGFVGLPQAVLWALLGSPPIVDPPEVVEEEYDLLFVGTPVWFGRPAAPLRRFLAEGRVQAKRIAVFCCCSLLRGGVFRHLAASFIPGSVIATTSFRAPMLHDEIRAGERARSWALDILNTMTAPL